MTQCCSAGGDFASDERKIRFDIAFPSLKRNRETLRIHYQLEGYDVDAEARRRICHRLQCLGALWNYTFRAKAENQGQFSEPVAYSFSIATPIYRRSWFTALILLVAAAVIGAIHRRQMTLQAAKARQINELNASKLAAIQSQMNHPFHF